MPTRLMTNANQRRWMIGFLLPALLLGCRAPSTGTPAVVRLGQAAGLPGAVSAAGAPAWNGEWGQVAMKVDLGTQRRLQFVEGHRAMTITAEVYGAGLTGWTALTPVDGTTGTFGAPSEDGAMVATLSAKVPAGDRRVFRVQVRRNAGGLDYPIEQLWGVADVPANVDLQRTYPVTIKRITTPTGMIFEKLLRIDAPKALTLPIANVQHYVEELLNTSALTGKPLRTNVPQVSHALLDIEQAAAAIVRGNRQVPFQIPVPIPQDILAPDAQDPLKRSLADGMRRRGGARLKVLDMHHQPIKRDVVYYLTDPATEPWLADADTAAEVAIDEVAPGTWDFVAIDRERGTVARKPITILDDQVTEDHAVMGPTTEVVAGAYDAERDLGDSYNGERVPPAFVYMNQPSGLFVKDGKFIFLDRGNQRVRGFDLGAPAPEVNSLAGLGYAGRKGEGGPATAAWVQLGADSDVARAADGAVYFIEDDGVLRRLGTDGTIKVMHDFPYGSGHLAYDAVRNDLFVGFNGNTGFKVDLDTLDPANSAASVVQPAWPKWGYGGTAYVTVAGDSLFYTYRYYVTNAYEILRYHIPTGQWASVFGGGTAALGDDTAAGSVSELTMRGLAIDRAGNAFYANADGLVRVTNVTTGTTASNQWRARLVLADPNIRRIAIDPDTDEMYILTFDNHVNAAGGTRAVPKIKRVIP